MRWGPAAIFLGVIAFSPAIAGEKRIRLPSIDGAYIQPSSSFTHPAPGEVEEVEVSNLLCIRRLSASKVEFYLKTWGDDANHCSGTGIAAIEKDKRGLYLHMAPSIKHTTPDDLINKELQALVRGSQIKGHGEDDAFPCELNIRMSQREFSIEPVSGKCNSHFMCGAKAGIAGWRFPRKSRGAIQDYGECFED